MSIIFNKYIDNFYKKGNNYKNLINFDEHLS